MSAQRKETAFGLAMASAGVRHAGDELRAMREEAVRLHPTDERLQRQAFLNRVDKDPFLFKELMSKYVRLAVDEFFSIAAREDAGHPDSAVKAKHDLPASKPLPNRRAAIIAGVAEPLRKSCLDTFRIQGRSIGDCNAGEARVWARRTGRDLHFVELLTYGLPADRPIRHYVRPEDADRLRLQANERAYPTSFAS